MEESAGRVIRRKAMAAMISPFVSSVFLRLSYGLRPSAQKFYFRKFKLRGRHHLSLLANDVSERQEGIELRKLAICRR